MRQNLTAGALPDVLTGCRRDQAKGNHLMIEPLYRTWQDGLVCRRCGRRRRLRDKGDRYKMPVLEVGP